MQLVNIYLVVKFKNVKIISTDFLKYYFYKYIYNFLINIFIEKRS
jgi:hypothetical protein